MKTYAYVTFFLASAASIVGCHSPAERTSSGSEARQEAASALAESATRPLASTAQTNPEVQLARLRWGHDVSGQASGPERLAEGPSSIAIDGAGQAFVLDRLAGRIVKQRLDGTVTEHTTVDHDSVDLSLSREGQLLTFSQVRARSIVYDRSGREIGEISVPRVLRHTGHVEWDAKGALWARSPYQERFRLGTVSEPSKVAAILASKQEGAVQRTDGTRFVVEVHGTVAHLAELSTRPTSPRDTIVRRLVMPNPATAAKIVGAWKENVCVRLELVGGKPALTVGRRLTCVDTRHERITLDVDLGPVGTYLPYRELAVGGGWVVQLLPQSGSLVTKRWRLDR